AHLHAEGQRRGGVQRNHQGLRGTGWQAHHRMQLLLRVAPVDVHHQGDRPRHRVLHAQAQLALPAPVPRALRRSDRDLRLRGWLEGVAPLLHTVLRRLRRHRARHLLQADARCCRRRRQIDHVCRHRVAGEQGNKSEQPSPFHDVRILTKLIKRDHPAALSVHAERSLRKQATRGAATDGRALVSEEVEAPAADCPSTPVLRTYAQGERSERPCQRRHSQYTGAPSAMMTRLMPASCGEAIAVATITPSTVSTNTSGSSGNSGTRYGAGSSTNFQRYQNSVPMPNAWPSYSPTVV